VSKVHLTSGLFGFPTVINKRREEARTEAVKPKLGSVPMLVSLVPVLFGVCPSSSLRRIHVARGQRRRIPLASQ
jgi:hypothetical protein